MTKKENGYIGNQNARKAPEDKKPRPKYFNLEAYDDNKALAVQAVRATPGDTLTKFVNRVVRAAALLAIKEAEKAE